MQDDVAHGVISPPLPFSRCSPLPCHNRTVKAELGDVDGILTFCEMAVPLASRLCEICGLPGNSCQAVDNARNKVEITQQPK